MKDTDPGLETSHLRKSQCERARAQYWSWREDSWVGADRLVCWDFGLQLTFCYHKKGSELDTAQPGG